jgi:hypothetical protein
MVGGAETWPPGRLCLLAVVVRGCLEGVKRGEAARAGRRWRRVLRAVHGLSAAWLLRSAPSVFYRRGSRLARPALAQPEGAEVKRIPQDTGTVKRLCLRPSMLGFLRSQLEVTWVSSTCAPWLWGTWGQAADPAKPRRGDASSKQRGCGTFR